MENTATEQTSKEVNTGPGYVELPREEIVANRDVLASGSLLPDGTPMAKLVADTTELRLEMSDVLAKLHPRAPADSFSMVIAGMALALKRPDLAEKARAHYANVERLCIFPEDRMEIFRK